MNRRLFLGGFTAASALACLSNLPLIGRCGQHRISSVVKPQNIRFGGPAMVGYVGLSTNPEVTEDIYSVLVGNVFNGYITSLYLASEDVEVMYQGKDKLTLDDLRKQFLKPDKKDCVLDFCHNRDNFFVAVHDVKDNSVYLANNNFSLYLLDLRKSIGTIFFSTEKLPEYLLAPISKPYLEASKLFFHSLLHLKDGMIQMI